MNNLHHNATFNFFRECNSRPYSNAEISQRKKPGAALRARETTFASLNSLIDFSEANRPVSEVPGHRELVIKFGSGGYVARYHYTFGSDVVLLFVKHQREVV